MKVSCVSWCAVVSDLVWAYLSGCAGLTFFSMVTNTLRLTLTGANFCYSSTEGGLYHTSLDFCHKASESYDFGTRG